MSTLDRRNLWIVMVALAFFLLAATVTMLAPAPATTPSDNGLAEEELERLETTRARLEQNRFIQRSGETQLGPITYLKNKVWDGEVIFGPGNDWEPDIAADPNAPYVYAFTTRYGGKWTACKDCPNPGLVYRVSADNGDTWGETMHVCKCKGIGWQADPQVEVADDGTVGALILSKWRTWFTKSTDHGQTWSEPVDVAPNLNWTDHGFLTMSPDGQDVYVAFNKGNSYVVASHDGGATWGPAVKTNPEKSWTRYYYHYKGVVLSDDTVVIAATSLDADPYARHLVRYYALRSTDGGATWQQIRLGTYERQPFCVNYGCRKDHFGAMSNVDADDADRLIYTMAGTNTPGKGQIVFIRTSTDGGVTWTPAKRVSPVWNGSRRVIASFPIVVAGASGDFRLAWMDDYNGKQSWNTWFTRTWDGGLSWTPITRISDAKSGAPYKDRRGYDADYGDYMGMAILSDGRTIATWGEAFSYWGPGGSWINREPFCPPYAPQHLPSPRC